jgi:uncharacterized membrane protein
MLGVEDTLGPAGRYTHDHPPVRNVLVEHAAKLSRGQRIADRLTAAMGSWPFIIIQSAVLLVWIAVNVYLLVLTRTHPGFLRSWDPYPFILLNLVLSFQAAYTGPIVMMSQNRASEKDRLMAQHDYDLNVKSEREIRVIMEHLAHQDRLLLDAIRRVEALPPLQPATAKLDEILRRLEANDRGVLARITRMEAMAAGSDSAAGSNGATIHQNSGDSP